MNYLDKWQTIPRFVGLADKSVVPEISANRVGLLRSFRRAKERPEPAVEKDKGEVMYALYKDITR